MSVEVFDEREYEEASAITTWLYATDADISVPTLVALEYRIRQALKKSTLERSKAAIEQYIEEIANRDAGKNEHYMDGLRDAINCIEQA